MAEDSGRLTVDEWERRVGAQIRELRLRNNVSQARIAHLSGVSISTIHNLEAGTGTSLATLVKVVRALGRADWLDQIAPPVGIDPMQMLRERRKARAGHRQRASRSTDLVG